ncbi:hypothetical protein CA54_60720 [Symmachiella macrocystis]|uniref:Uncharacterized protein n=1 Tax=Symmachiella macrocystis TaxID=2527985 RepID=A0A5C6AWS0_9PLAN|nr:hypothetical protein [Symmachiella macrocystis]TWU04190.1 hypothetical protein CA54_60720 [Symmachiella macrocystis]
MHDPHDVKWYERVADEEPVVATAGIEPAIDSETACMFDIARYDGSVIAK